jgi:sulfatase modifying factor 1
LEEIPQPVQGRDFMVESVAMPMIWVKPGTFQMGSPAGQVIKEKMASGLGYAFVPPRLKEDGGFFSKSTYVEKAIGGENGRDADETLHTVTLTEGYWLGKHEVTQAEWERVMGSNPSEYKGADRPVETVSWTEVTSFCAKLTASERAAGRLPAGMTYQLPTEAQWEYACRAGTKTAFSFGDELTAKDANYAYDGFGTGLQRTSNVGEYASSPWGFYDMHGNVWEWCADWYGDYPTGAVHDPVGPADGSSRVFRGGSWSPTALFARSANRYRLEPANSIKYLGFRLSLRLVSQ